MPTNTKIKAKTKAISFEEKDFDVLEFLKSQDNASKYLVRLVRADINHMSLESRVEHLVHKILKSQDLNIGNQSELLNEIMGGL
jgi:hypothetical protein